MSTLIDYTLGLAIVVFHLILAGARDEGLPPTR
jgi:hypothetical protein